ncbi:hypothetical protein QZH41_013777 [Actinostola sp. cb2023]|nr:hypothetical protein QZH41_013777 [Actinostola sp. cb2023]
MASQFGNGNVIVVTDDKLFDVELERCGRRLVVVEFTASWCGPCQKIAPVFVQLSMKYMSVTFLKVDIEQCPFTAESNGVRAMPTFLFYRAKSKVGEHRGADPLGLENKLKDLSGPPQINNHIFPVAQWLECLASILVPDRIDIDHLVDPKRVAIGQCWSCFIELQANERSVFMETSEIILKFANNLLNNPDNKKYRSIRIGNKIFQAKLLTVMGGVECLFAMGFEEHDDHLVFPANTSTDALQTLRDAIYEERIKNQSSTDSPRNGCFPSLPSQQSTAQANKQKITSSFSISTEGMVQYYRTLIVR